MTVCIAAVAGLSANPTIVCCSDSLMSGSLGSTETTLKNKPTASGWGILVAGEDSEITAMISLFRAGFRNAFVRMKMEDTLDDFDEAAALSLVREALLIRKKEKADELIQGQYGISYDELRKTGGKDFPPDLFREAMWNVRDCMIPAEFIVHGFTGMKMPTLIQTSQNGKAYIRDNFAVIGSGGYLAHSVMMHRAHHEHATEDAALYSVYEAKRYAEGDVAVGKKTTIITGKADGGRFIISAEGLAWAKARYEEFGPRPVDESKLTLPDNAFTELWSAKNPPVIK